MEGIWAAAETEVRAALTVLLAGAETAVLDSYWLWKFGGNSGLVIGASMVGVKQKICASIYYLYDSPPLAVRPAPSVTNNLGKLLIAVCENYVI